MALQDFQIMVATRSTNNSYLLPAQTKFEPVLPEWLAGTSPA